MSAARHLAEAAGNRFLVVDAREGDAPADPAALARSARAEHGLDGVLELRAPDAGGDCRMVVWNADGGRAEACGNGLRCVALVALAGADGALVVETDTGPRRVRVAGGRVRAELGPALVEPAVAVELDSAGTGGREVVVGRPVSVGNPHLVVRVDDVAAWPLARLGAALARHPRFPAGTNVEAWAPEPDGALRVRVFERGVGETGSCGTGAGAVAAAAVADGAAASPVRVRAPGGELEVEVGADGELLLAGPVRILQGTGPSR